MNRDFDFDWIGELSETASPCTRYIWAQVERWITSKRSHWCQFRLDVDIEIACSGGFVSKYHLSGWRDIWLYSLDQGILCNLFKTFDDTLWESQGQKSSNNLPTHAEGFRNLKIQESSSKGSEGGHMRLHCSNKGSQYILKQQETCLFGAPKNSGTSDGLQRARRDPTD